MRSEGLSKGEEEIKEGPRSLSKLGVNVATCGPLGYIPVFPGTMGSLLGVVFHLAGEKLLGEWSWIWLIGGLVLALWACEIAEEFLGKKDPPQVILDEVVGMALALLGSEGRGVYLAVGFILFRVLDILKPPPMNVVQKRLRGGLAIVGDDLLAGLGTMVLMRLLVRFGVI